MHLTAVCRESRQYGAKRTIVARIEVRADGSGSRNAPNDIVDLHNSILMDGQSDDRRSQCSAGQQALYRYRAKLYQLNFLYQGTCASRKMALLNLG